jgi:hypothetical protein
MLAVLPTLLLLAPAAQAYFILNHQCVASRCARPPDLTS